VVIRIDIYVYVCIVYMIDSNDSSRVAGFTYRINLESSGN